MTEVTKIKGLKRLRKYIAILKINFITGIQYRTAAIAGIITQIVFGLIFIMLYKAFYESAKIPPEMPFNKLVTYLWCIQAFLALVTIWWQDNDLLQNISDGNIAYELNKPISLYKYCFARISGKRIANVSIRFLPVIIISLLLPEPYRFTLPSKVFTVPLFLLSLVISLVLVTCVSMFLYIITLKTLSSVAPKMIMSIVFDFFSGFIIPVPLMPDKLQDVLFFLPFRYIGDWSFQIFSENISPERALAGLGIGIVWAIVLLLSGELLMMKLQKSVIIQGG